MVARTVSIMARLNEHESDHKNVSRRDPLLQIYRIMQSNRISLGWWPSLTYATDF